MGTKLCPACGERHTWDELMELAYRNISDYLTLIEHIAHAYDIDPGPEFGERLKQALPDTDHHTPL